MYSQIISVLLGSDQTRTRRDLYLVLAVGLFGTVFAGYAIGVFYVSGGLVWIPYYAAVVGMISACAIGYYRDGLVIAWMCTYTSLLGYHADHAFIGLPSRSFFEQLAYFTRLDGLAFLGVEAVILGMLAFTFGYILGCHRTVTTPENGMNAGGYHTTLHTVVFQPVEGKSTTH